MCVIIVKPAGVEMPEFQTLAAAYMANPHGCGFCTPRGRYRTMQFNDFVNALAEVKTEEPCIIHFRFATHGSKRESNCHPFKAGNVYFAHNGILDITPRGDMTDSETAFKDIIYPAIKKYGWLSPKVDAVINEIIGYSKFAIMRGSQFALYGSFIRDNDGCYYSNFNFKRFLYHTRCAL